MQQICKLLSVWEFHHVQQTNAIDSLGLTPKNKGKRGLGFLGGRTSDAANNITLKTTEIGINWGEKSKHPLKEETPELTICNITRNSNDSLEEKPLGVTTIDSTSVS